MQQETQSLHYFLQCATTQEVKARYKKLAKEHHPDAGGDTATMQAINREYALAATLLAQGAGLSGEETDNEVRLSEAYRQVIESIITLPGIVIEVVGNWIWVSGNTYPVRKQLQAAGLFFAGKKKAWYYRAEEYKTKSSNKTLEEIKNKYGSEMISTKSKYSQLSD